MDCPSDGSQLKRSQIQQMLAEGYTKSEIRKAFIEMYGNEVLVSPPFSGFNLFVWIMPFVALFGAGYFVTGFMKRRLANEAEQTMLKKGKGKNKQDFEVTEQDVEALQEEMKKYL
ncbi:MAG: cytochrome c-type biogenesis protein CcmH [Bacillota bacterium]|nr:cytochrome c-type biogenesis protein CcmH [Bacillota bacterium]